MQSSMAIKQVNEHVISFFLHEHNCGSDGEKKLLSLNERITLMN
jgi:hypothetical protein